MATFKRTNPAARRAFDRVMRKQKVAEKLAKQPSVTLFTSATEDRTDVKNVIIFRTHAKRLGVRLKLSMAEIKKMLRESPAAYKMIGAGDARGVEDLLTRVGEEMVKAIRRKIRKENLWETGQLWRSISYKLSNVK